MAKGFQRVDHRPKSKSGWRIFKPATITQRERIQDKCGSVCFLMPAGTPARKGVPAYPICARLDKTGGQCVLSCPGMEAAYKRLMMGIVHYTYPEGYKAYMRAAVNRVIRLARQHADPKDPTNTCNWSLRASYQRTY